MSPTARPPKPRKTAALAPLTGKPAMTVYQASALEAHEQITVIELRDRYKDRYPALALLVASANGEARPRQQNPRTGKWFSPAGQKLKAMGVVPGWPDLQLAAARQGYHGLFIEMKRRGQHSTPDQAAMHARLRREGYLVLEFDFWLEAWAAIVDYLALPPDLLNVGL